MQSNNFRVAAKAFIVRDGKLLMMKRRSNDPHKPNSWDIPGGRLEPGENPYEGLARECQEEISSEVEILMPIDVQHFVRDDGQQITLIMFFCSLRGETIKLSEEHQEHDWIDLNTRLGEIPKFFYQAIDHYQEYLKHD